MATLTRMTLFAIVSVSVLYSQCAVFAQESAVLEIPEIVPPEIAEGRQEISLPDVVDDINVGGDGRYLALHFKSLQKIGVFDVNQLKITGYVSASDGDTKFAAGATKLVVVSGDSGVVSRWDLQTVKRELTQSIDLGGSAGHVVLGSASAGPVVVSGVGNGYRGPASLIDMETLRVTPFQVNNSSRGFGRSSSVRVSANGDVMGVWALGVSPSGLQSYVKTGDSWAGYYEHQSVGMIIPSPDGKRLYTGRGIYTNQLRRLGEGGSVQGYSIPAVHGPYYVSLTGNDVRRKSEEKVFLKLEGDERPLVEIPNLDPLFDNNDRWSRQTLTMDKRFFLIPRANLVLQLSTSHQELIAVKLDMEQALRESEVEYLIVSSRPPLKVKAGSNLRYQIDVRSKVGGVKYSLEAAPPDMQLSPSGLLTWTTSKRSPEKVNVILAISDDSGQEVFHTFNLTVDGGDARQPIVATTVQETNGDVPSSIVTTPTNVSEQSKEIKLPGMIGDVVAGSHGRLLFLHLRDLKRIAVLDVSQAKIVGYLPASDDNTKIVAGATRALVFSLTQGVVTRYRLDTLKRELSVAIPFPGAVQYLGMGAGSEGPVLLRTSQGTGQLDRCSFDFLDLNTMKPLEVSWKNGHQPHSVYRDRNHITVSTNGEAFVVSGMGVLRLNGDSVEVLGNHSFHGALPSADGKKFMASGRMYNAELQAMGDSSTTFGVAIPSVTGPFFLSFAGGSVHTRTRSEASQNAKLYLYGDSRPLVTIQNMKAGVVAQYGNSSIPPGSSRVFLIPDAHVIATVLSSNDQVELRKFNIDEALDASGVDYLVVTSQAPRQAELGKTYLYTPNVKSKNQDVTYRLDAAPPGMSVSSEGKIMWKVPQSIDGVEHPVVLAVSDASGQSTYHTFTVQIRELAEKRDAARQQREEQARLAKAKAQAEAREALKNRREEQRAIQLRPMGAGADRNQTSEPSFEEWTDSSGKHVLRAKFVKIIDRKTVVLELENGEERHILLSRLNSASIYEAVRKDLLKQGGIPIESTTESPFQRPE